jgi:hypothetical protein
MLKSGQRKPQQIPSLLYFFLQHNGKVELHYKMKKVDNISGIRKYYIVMHHRQHS